MGLLDWVRGGSEQAEDAETYKYECRTCFSTFTSTRDDEQWCEECGAKTIQPVTA